MLSIIIPTHQRTDLLQACLRAVTAHAPAGTEIIVVDDASPNAAASGIVTAFGARAVRMERRSGFARAANAGIHASRGDIIEMLNDDTEVQPGWADAVLPWFANPALGSVAPLVLAWPDGKFIDSAGDQYFLAGVARKRGHGQAVTPHFLRPSPVFGVSAAAGFYRRSALERVGLFAEEFGSYFEDVDLAFRLRRAGFHAICEPNSRVLHHVSASHGRRGRALIERQSCNEERVFWRNLPTPILRRALPMHFAVLAGKAILRAEEGTLAAWLLGRWRAWSDWRAIVRHRGQLPAGFDFASWGVDDSWAIGP